MSSVAFYINGNMYKVVLHHQLAANATSYHKDVTFRSHHQLQPQNSIQRIIRCDSAIIPYQVVKRSDKYDLRLYSPYIVAKCSYLRRDEGFLSLGSYLTPNKMKETQPVVMNHPPNTNNNNNSSKTMQVYLLPRNGDPPELQTLPQPEDPYVTLAIAGGSIVAVGQLTGYATKEACEARLRQLRVDLKKDGLKIDEDEGFSVAQYGPMFSLEERLNEVWLTVSL